MIAPAQPNSGEWEPTRGQFLGPAWLRAASYLRTGDFYRVDDLCAEMTNGTGLRKPTRAYGRLHGAIAKGWLERRGDCVRVTDKGRQERPELRAGDDAE